MSETRKFFQFWIKHFRPCFLMQKLPTWTNFHVKKNCGANCFLCWEIEFYLTEAMQFLSFKRLTCSYYNSGSFFSSNICGLKAVENSLIWKPGPKKIFNTRKICFIDQLCWKIKALSRWLSFVLQISKKFYVDFFWH